LIPERLNLIRDAGVIGAGGAGFPTHVKLGAKVQYVIANGAECEPLLRGDRQLMERFPEDVMEGMKVAMELTGARKGYIGVKAKYEKAVKALEKALEDHGNENIELFALDNFYPAGDEQVLVYEVLGRVVPEAGLPLDVGVVVSNVGTLTQVAHAVEGKNVTERWVTVTGAVKEPQTLKLPIGTPASVAIEIAGGPTRQPCSVIAGGPMMGKLLHSVEEPITKTTSGLVVLPRDHYVIGCIERPVNVNVRYAIAACIQCRMCTDICPRYNLGHYVCPDKVMKGIAYGIMTRAEHMTTALICVECGLCTHYGCPMGLDPKGFMKKVKEDLLRVGMKNPHTVKNPKPNEYRSFRKVPLRRLISRLGLSEYDVDAPMIERDMDVKRVEIPLKQHIGAPSVPAVRVGERVAKCQLIASIPDNALGAAYHASIGGIITNIDDSITIESDRQ